MGRMKTPMAPPPPPTPSPAPTRVDTSGQQRVAEQGMQKRRGRSSTILTSRGRKAQKLGANNKSSNNILGQYR